MLHVNIASAEIGDGREVNMVLIGTSPHGGQPERCQKHGSRILRSTKSIAGSINVGSSTL